MEALAKKTPLEVTYIEETNEQETILFNSNSCIWSITFWAVFVIMIVLMGMGVVTG